MTTTGRILALDVGLRNLGVCVLGVGAKCPPQLLENWDLLQGSKIQFKNVTTDKLHALAQDLVFVRLGKEFFEEQQGITHVGIERQIPRGNKKIVLFSNLLFQAFLCRQREEEFKLEFVCPKKKFHFCDEQQTKKAKTYAQRKKASVEIATSLGLDLTGITGKKDDICDAFLLAKVVEQKLL